MLVHIYTDLEHFCSNKLPKAIDDIKYISSAVGNTGWVLVKEDGGEIILPFGVVIEKFESGKGEVE